MVPGFTEITVGVSTGSPKRLAGFFRWTPYLPAAMGGEAAQCLGVRQNCCAAQYPLRSYTPMRTVATPRISRRFSFFASTSCSCGCRKRSNTSGPKARDKTARPLLRRWKNNVRRCREEEATQIIITLASGDVSLVTATICLEASRPAFARCILNELSESPECVPDLDTGGNEHIDQSRRLPPSSGVYI